MNGEEHRRDLIILPERVIPDWRREQGHRLSLTDLREVIEYGPDILVVGTGAGGVMKVPRDVIDELTNRGIEVVTARAGKAVLEYNKMIGEGRRRPAPDLLTEVYRVLCALL